MVFLPEGNYDHTPALLSVYPDMRKKTPFSLHNMWCNHPPPPLMLNAVRNEWGKQVMGCPMFKVCEKLNLVKQALKVMNKEGFGDVEANVIKAKHDLANIGQEQMHRQMDDVSLVNREIEALARLRTAQLNMSSLLQQKSKLAWLRCRDENTNIFLSSS